MNHGHLDRQRRRGIALSALGVLLLSPEGLLVRLAGALDPWTILFYRSLFLGTSLGLYTWFSARSGADTSASPRWGGTLRVAASMALCNTTFILALTATDVANVLVVMATQPFLGALFGWWLLSERPERRTAVAACIAFVGALTMFGGELQLGWWTLGGNALAAVAAASQALALVFVRRDNVHLPTALALASMLSFLAAAPLSAPLSASPQDLLVLLVLGSGFLPVALTLFLAGARHASAAEVALLATIETVVGPLLVWLGLGERPGPFVFLGGVVVLVAILVDVAPALSRRVPRVPRDHA